MSRRLIEPMRLHDVVVVGARCAGAATAMLLAAAGHDVLLVDRDTFPSDTLSTHAIARSGMVQLNRWGLLPDVLATGAPPLRDGWVAIADQRIVAYGSDAERGESSRAQARDIDLGNVAILPGLVNAHTHLELSHLRGRVAAGRTFVSWIRALLAARRGDPGPDAPEILAAIDEGIAEAIRCGTAVVGDISNTLATCAPLAASDLDAVVFHEIIGFNPDDPIALVNRAATAIRRTPSTCRNGARSADG